MNSRLIVLAIVCILHLSLNVQADWNRFRGPNGTGIAEGAAPVSWSPKENIKWKTPLPGSGVSSPIVVGEKIFITAYTGYGESRDNRGSMEELARHLLCIDVESGAVLWQKDIPNEIPEDAYSGAGIPAHGYASHTPTSDGEHVFAFFGKTGVIAYDMDGNEAWRASVGTDSDPRRWGSASSPILHEDVLVVTAGPESRAVIGLDKKTGKELWRADADGFGNVWGTPAVVKSGETTDIVIGAPYEIWALNPETGKLRWWCEAMDSDSFNSSVVVSGDTVYAVEGRSGGSIALKAGGKDDITKTNTLWSGRDRARFGSPVVYQDRLYYVSGGAAYCLDAKTGEEVFRGRLRASDVAVEPQERQGDEPRRGPGGGGQRGGRGGPGGRGGSADYASPVVADGHVYFINGGGEIFVFKAGTEELKQVAANRVTAASETFAATPAISGGKIFIRSNKHLYCVGE